MSFVLTLNVPDNEIQRLILIDGTLQDDEWPNQPLEVQIERVEKYLNQHGVSTIPNPQSFIERLTELGLFVIFPSDIAIFITLPNSV